MNRHILLVICFVFAAGMSAQQPNKATITTFDAPGAGTASSQGTYANNINAAGDIVGNYEDPSNVSHGYVRAAKWHLHHV